ncbi:MAG: 16S rRNA (cytidine(1402)-2'-O)-methyltransferase [Patescibacteria group bacterium]
MLYIIATPIGNLEDMTFRAIRILKEVDLIACEDTRVTRTLLDHYEIKTPTVSYFAHSKLSKIDYLIGQLEAGKSIALVSDAGTPGISDPGEYLIRRIREIRNSKSEILNISQTPIVPIPGPSALTAAASVSGMIDKEFYFAGFLPKKKGRQTELKMLSSLSSPVVIYESAVRIERTLRDIEAYFGDKTQVFIAREITKMFEEYWGGNIKVVITDLSIHKLKGEIVLIVKK